MYAHSSFQVENSGNSKPTNAWCLQQSEYTECMCANPCAASQAYPVSESKHGICQAYSVPQEETSESKYSRFLGSCTLPLC